ncbi:trichohyalin [Bombina bombina]|uniref:trichohyalin n=1 Tax=Bombina bombina TaxID=8345 RepID=UPI00235AD1B1|nr:trichohyalin [Bombina bombina]
MEPPGHIQNSIDLGNSCHPGTTRKRQVRFTAQHDIMLLREVIHQNPFSVREAGQVWALVAEEMNNALRGEGFEVDARRCRERTALLLDYYKRQNFTGLRRCGTESLCMEKEDLLQAVLELEAEKRAAEPRHRDPPQDTLTVTIGEDTLREMPEEALAFPNLYPSPYINPSAHTVARGTQCSTSSSTPATDLKQEEENLGERPSKKRACEGCCGAYARILQHLERRSEAEQRLREEELVLRREELQLQRERAAIERERQEAESRERERRFELEREERHVILDILREKMMK